MEIFCGLESKNDKMLEVNPNLEISRTICQGIETIPVPCHVHQENEGRQCVCVCVFRFLVGFFTENAKLDFH